MTGLWQKHGGGAKKPGSSLKTPTELLGDADLEASWPLPGAAAEELARGVGDATSDTEREQEQARLASRDPGHRPPPSQAPHLQNRGGQPSPATRQTRSRTPFIPGSPLPLCV